MQEYLVVEFSDDLSVGVVFRSWFKKTDGKYGTVSWPPSRNVTAAVKKKVEPLESWTRYKARLLSESGTCKVNCFNCVDLYLCTYRNSDTRYPKP